MTALQEVMQTCGYFALYFIVIPVVVFSIMLICDYKRKGGRQK